MKLRLLKDDSGYDRNVILDVRKPEKPIEETSAKTEATESESESGMLTQAGRRCPATPIKLTLSDVESVLGVLKNVVQTPKSVSSLTSSTVNRMSNHVVSDFLAEFLNLDGEGEDYSSIPTLGNLNIS